MAVYTHFSERAIEEYIEDFNIGNVISLEGITEGIDNTNYKLETTSGDYIITIFEDRVDAKDLPFYMGLMQHLYTKGVPCPEVILNNKGEQFSLIKKKLSAITTFMPGGSVRKITKDYTKNIGKALGKMHVAAEGFNMQHENSMSLSKCKSLIEDCSEFIKREDRGLLCFLREEIEYQETEFDDYSVGIPKGAIHADLFSDNVFFNDLKEVSAVFDFYFSCTGFFIYDLMLTINAWCFDRNGVFDVEKKEALIIAYKEERDLSPKEIKGMNFFGRMAALRIVASRMYDWHHPVRGGLVNLPNPEEHINIIKFYQEGTWD